MWIDRSIIARACRRRSRSTSQDMSIGQRHLRNGEGHAVHHRRVIGCRDGGAIASGGLGGIAKACLNFCVMRPHGFQNAYWQHQACGWSRARLSTRQRRDGQAVTISAVRIDGNFGRHNRGGILPVLRLDQRVSAVLIAPPNHEPMLKGLIKCLDCVRCSRHEGKHCPSRCRG